MQDIKKIWDVKNLLNWSIEHFTSKGINQPKLSAELLLADALNFTRMQIYLNFEHKPDQEEIARFKDYILKRVEHMPIQYILKKAFFRNLELYVDENVLIPRPETELLVDRVLNIMADIVREKAAGFFGDSSGQTGTAGIADINLNILEIGTGSGAIALSLIKEGYQFIAKAAGAGKNGSFKIESRENTLAGGHLRLDSSPANPGTTEPGNLDLGNQGSTDSGKPGQINTLRAAQTPSYIKLKVTATEKSKSALNIALINANNLLSEEEIRNVDFVEADIIPAENSLFTNEFKGKINIVVSNPPYISEENYNSLPQEVQHFEPKCALLAGKTGLEIYKKIVDQVCSLTDPGNSFLVFEIDPYVSPGLQKYITESLKPENIEIHKDYNQLERIMVVKI